MKLFIRNIIIFTTVILLFNAYLFSIVNNIYFKPYSKVSLDYNSYLFADSHGSPLNDFTEKYGVYNFSAGSDSYFDIQRKLHFLLSKKIKIETIYLTADDHTLSPYRELTNNLNRSIVYVSSIDYNDFYLFFKERYLQYYIPLFSQNETALLRKLIISKLKKTFSIKKPKKDKNYKLSWHELSLEQRFKASQRRKTRQFPSENKSLKLEKTLIDIIELCRKHGIKLIGLKFPLANEHIQVLDKASYNADKILLDHGITVLEFTDIFIKNTEYFYNQDHLNNKGGELFTDLLLKK